MMFIIGERMFGKADHVPGLFYVATRFLHIWWFPLAPEGRSYLILDDASGRALKIKFSFKSCLLGWLRATCFVLGPILFGMGVVMACLLGRLSLPVLGIALGMATVGAGLIGLAIWSYYFIRIGRERAVTVAEKAGMDPSLVHAFFDRLEGRPRPGPLDDAWLREAMRTIANTTTLTEKL